MKTIVTTAAALLILTGVAIPTAAQEVKNWGKPTVEYSADMVFTNDRGRSRTARLYYTADKQRLEYKAGKEIVAILFDQPSKKAYQLLLNAKGWRPIRAIVPQFTFGMAGPKAKLEKVGEERMAGFKVTKFNVNSKTFTGDEFNGVAWATKERIVLKMVGTVQRGKQRQRLTLVLQNLKIGPVDTSLLSVPKDYKKLPPLKKR